MLLDKLEIRGWEVSVLFCDDELMARLNKKYRGKNNPTDVLSFRQDDHDIFPAEPDAPHIAGDIVISIDTLKRNAKSENVKAKTELLRLLIHAFLHLKGMDHNDKDTRMIRLQEKILSELEDGNE
jgi:probable rRNA maturation factor